MIDSAAVGDFFKNSSAGQSGSSITNVWLVDRPGIFRSSLERGFAQTIDLSLSGYFSTPTEALEWRRNRERPDVILLEAQTAGFSPVQAVHQFRAAFPAAPLILITDSIPEQVLSDALCAGASGCLPRSAPIDKITESVRDVRDGGAALTPAVARLMLDMVRRLSFARAHYKLTARELSILRLMGQGLLMKEIAQQLELSYHTVDSHLRNIYSKLNVHSRTAAVAKALREQLV